MATLDDIMKLLQKNTTSMNDGFKDMKEEMSQLKTDMKDFKTEIKKTVDDSLKTTNDKVQMLETKLQEKEEEIQTLRKESDIQKRQNNLLLFNVPENEVSIHDLQITVVNLVRRVLNIPFSEADLNDVYRIGRKHDKIRPILVSLVSHIKLKTLLANKHSFKNENVGVSQDFPKSVNDERKRLQPMVTALNQSGKKAVLRTDQLIVDGVKWDRTTIEDELLKFNAKKRSRSPPEAVTNPTLPKPQMPPTNDPKRSKTAPATSVSTPNTMQTTPKSSQQQLATATTPTTANMFPMFKGAPTNTLSPFPGGKSNAQTFGIISKD